MALGLEDKKAIVAEVQEAAKGALSAVVADSRGVAVEDMTALRKQAREAGVWLKVVRNTLALVRLKVLTMSVWLTLSKVRPSSLSLPNIREQVLASCRISLRVTTSSS